tara:strand:- start:103 stop:510 length:408 start_codon:yes stop_codon:yes gene_type:complete
MNSFFVKPMIKKARMEVCKDCKHYFKPTGNCLKCGCFMKIKASIGVMECPDKKWLKTNEVTRLDKIPKDLIKESFDIWEGIKTGEAMNHEYKKRAVTLYNTIHGTGYSTGTNCSSCLNSVRNEIKKIINENKSRS